MSRTLGLPIEGPRNLRVGSLRSRAIVSAVDKRRLLPPEVRAFCEARYRGGEYARPAAWRDPIRYKNYVSRTVETTNRKRSIAAFEYLWLEQSHPELVEYHQPSLPLPRNEAESLRRQRENVERIEGQSQLTHEERGHRLVGGIPGRAFLVAGGIAAAVVRWDDPRVVRDGAIVLGIMAGAIAYAFLWLIHSGSLSIARHRRVVASVRRQVEQEEQQMLERFLDEMHRMVSPRLQPYRG